MKRVQVTNADDPEQAEEVEILCPKRLGDLPRHLHRQVVNEHQRSTTSNQHAAAGVGYIYRPSNVGPRKMVNEFEINIRCVFVSSKDQYQNFRGEYFKSVLAKIKEEDEEEKLLLQEQQEQQEEEKSKSSSSSSTLENSGYGGADRDLKKRNNAWGKVKLMIDVRWETRQLEAAVRDALGMNSPSASMSGDPTKAPPAPSSSSSTKVTPINLFHFDKELMENPGAVAQGLHCNYLSRPWEKLHTVRMAEFDDVIACICP